MFTNIISVVAVAAFFGTFGVTPSVAETPEQYCQKKRNLGMSSKGYTSCLANQTAKQQRVTAQPIMGGETGRNKRQ